MTKGNFYLSGNFEPEHLKGYSVVSWLGGNDIYYEYIVPYGKELTFYDDAISVRSRKTDNPKNKWKSMKNGRKNTAMERVRAYIVCIANKT